MKHSITLCGGGIGEDKGGEIWLDDMLCMIRITFHTYLFHSQNRTKNHGCLIGSRREEHIREMEMV